MFINLSVPKTLKIAAVIAAISFCALVIGAKPVMAAGTFSYPSYNVDIAVNKDSTVNVTETLTYRFLGLFHGVTRDITLYDPNTSGACASNSNLTCGGFDKINITGLYDGQGNPVDPSTYTTGIVTDENTDARNFNIKWTIWPDGQLFDGTKTFTWVIKYKLYGSIGFIGTNAASKTPYLYWNALPSTRGGSIDATKITVTLPAEVQADDNLLQVYNDFGEAYTSTAVGNKVTISATDLGSSGNFTIAYNLPKGSVDIPATLQYAQGLPFAGVDVTLDGTNLGDLGGTFNSLPAGTHTVTFSYNGYQTRTTAITAVAGQVVSVDATLTPTAITLVMLIGDVLLNLLGLALVPISVIYVYIRWRNRGRDQNLPATFIPLFSPPAGVRPYLLGSIKDEKVDREDVTGSIIDLAYRGYIKIKELSEGKNYELTRLEGKPKDEGLNAIEQQLLDDIFDGEDVQETKKLGDTFAAKYPKLQNKIYDEMVDRGYFKESPQTTRGKYFGCGFGILALGIVASILLTVALIPLIGVPGPLFIGVALSVLGISFLISANYMPAKTSEGSKVYGEVMGFRMYMYYAERYRVQGLTPEEFEKFLSYAIVFGIEQEWAKKFADIYKGQPDWYEGPGGLHNVFWYSSFSRSFANSLNSTMYTPVTTGSASGSGWSGGGGSFGGFSGGGGGGGGSGAF